MDIAIMVLLFVVGAMMGSFACCQVWRLRKGDKSKFSHCMSCRKQIAWYDNVPILSWLVLRGRCRYCRKKIGVLELLAEVGLGAVFALSFWLWPWRAELMAGDGFEIAKAVVFFTTLVVLTVGFIYDAKWFELPVVVMLIEIALALVFAGVMLAQKIYTDSFSVAWVWGMLGALMILPVLYFLLYKVSNEKWVGGGDWILNVGLALMLADFWLALFTMFLANVLACVVAMPSALRKKDMNMRIPFGPFLIIAFWVIFMFQDAVLALVAI